MCSFKVLSDLIGFGDKLHMNDFLENSTGSMESNNVLSAPGVVLSRLGFDCLKFQDFNDSLFPLFFSPLICVINGLTDTFQNCSLCGKST